MSMQSTLAAGIESALKALSFPVVAAPDDSCDPVPTGAFENPASVHHCPEELTFIPDKCTRSGACPNDWRWETTIRFKGQVWTVDTIREWQKAGLNILYAAENMTWRVVVNSITPSYRPNTNPSYGSKLKLNLTLKHI